MPELPQLLKTREPPPARFAWSCYNHTMNKIDFLSIGDIVVDAFIKLKQADIVGQPDTPDYKICVQFGEKVPYEEVDVIYAVGNASNAAISAARLGLKPGDKVIYKEFKGS